MDESEAGSAPQPSDGVAGVVLAAGAARRYGATKQLALLDGEPLVNHAIRLLHRAGLERVVVVTGHDGDAVELAVDPATICIRNDDYARGQSTSVAAGLVAAERLEPAVDVAVVVLADQPRMPAAVVQRVLVTSRRTGRPARARFTDAAGPPVALPRTCWADVRAQLQGDAGAGSFLDGLGVVDVPVDLPMPRDVDRVSDLRSLSASSADAPGEPSPSA